MRLEQHLHIKIQSECDFITQIYEIDQDCSKLYRFPQYRYRFVTAIYLINCNIDLAVIQIIRNAQFKFIKTLDLSYNIIDAYSCKVLSSCHWMYLQKLNISHNVIKNKGLAHLMRAHWPQLKQLRIGNNKITNDGISNLLKCRFSKLQHIQLSSNYSNVTNQSFRYLWRLNLKNMHYVQLYQYPELLQEFSEFYSLNELAKFQWTNQRLTIEVIFTMYSRRAAILVRKNQYLLFQCDMSQQFF